MDDPKVKYTAALKVAKEAAALGEDRLRPVKTTKTTLQPEGKIEVTRGEITLGEWMNMNKNKRPQVHVKVDFGTRKWKSWAYEWATLSALVDKIEKRVVVHEKYLTEEDMSGVFDSARSALADIHAAYHPVACALAQTHDVEITPEMAKAAKDFIRSRDALEKYGVIKRRAVQISENGRVIEECIGYVQ